MSVAWLLFVSFLGQMTGPIRSHSDRIVAAMDEARRRSPTFRKMVERLETSDLIVYVESGHCENVQVLSCVSIAAAGGGHRYLRITIDTDHSRQLITSQLAHELHHAVEIADAAEVTDAAALAALYRRIGTTSARLESYETAAAIQTAATVLKELIRHR